MAVSQTYIGTTKNVVALPYFKTNVADADGTLNAQTTDLTEYAAVYPGSIIGVGVLLNGTLNTGTLTPRATINGSLCPPFEGTLTIGVQTTYVQQEGRKDNFAFNPGDRLGLMYNKSGTIEPTSNDATAVLLVLHEEVFY